MRRIIPAVGIILAAVLVMGCEPTDGGKAKKASYAGDGATMFTDSALRACSGDTQFCAAKGSGKLRFGKGYKAQAVDKSDRKNCEWSLYTINQEGKTTVLKRGTYGNANIKVDRPTRVKVYLKSSECGDWKP